MKKRFLPLTMLMALVAVPSYSQSEDNSGGTFTVTPAFASQYMFRGVRLGGLSFQPTVEYARGPWTLGAWVNLPLAKDEGMEEIPTWLYEYDFYASYEWAIVPDTFTITPGITFYSYPRVDETLEGDDTYKMTIEPSLSFGYTVKDITFSLNLFYDITLKGPSYEFGIDYTIPIKPIDIELSALVGSYSWTEYSPNYKLKNTGSYWQAGIAIPYEFSENSNLTVGWYYTKGLDNNFHEEGEKFKNPDAVGRGVFNVSFSYRF